MPINNPEKLTDQELVKLSLENQDFFGHIIDRYEIKLKTYVKRLTNISPTDIEDLMQEIFIKTYTNLNDFDFNKDIKFSSWIYRISHNHTISNYRKIKARPQVTPGETNEIILNNIIGDFDIIKKTDQKILKKNIFKILNALPIKYKEVLVLKFFEEKSYEEIGDILKKPPGTIATLIRRAKISFKKTAHSLNTQF